jgi:hypothetical protein
MAEIDLTALVRDMTSTMRAVATYAQTRRDDPSSVAGVDPFARLRWVSTRGTYEALASRKGDPAAPYLAAWSFAFAQARVNREIEVAAALARHREIVRLAISRPEVISVRAAVHRLVAESVGERREAIAGAVAASAGDAAGKARELWSRRAEVAYRLGTDDADGPLSPLSEGASSLSAVAERALVSTDAIFAQVSRAAGSSWASVLGLGTARDDDLPWPRVLSVSSIAELFRGESGWLAVHDLALGDMPTPVAGSSFTRALARFGARWADAAASREVALPLASVPHGLARFRIGALVAGLLANEAFLGKTLGFSRTEAERARRSQARIALVAFRLSAARVLVRRAAYAGDSHATAEVAREAFGRALGRDYPPELALVLPVLRARDPARLLAFGEGARLGIDLVARHDDDWFRNPRAVFDLRDRLGRSPPLALAEQDALAGVDAISRELTALLA